MEWIRARGHRKGYRFGSEVTGKGIGWGQRSQERVWVSKEKGKVINQQ